MNALPALSEYNFREEILVICPSCRRCAVSAAHTWSERWLSCVSCGLTRRPEPPGLKLWLEIETRHGTLHAFNYAHLSYIADYVSAGLRKVDFTKTTIRNGAITSRLPRWIKSAKNRTLVLHAINRLRRK